MRSLLITLILLTAAGLSAGQGWEPISQSELQLKTPKIDPGADAEILFWSVKLRDEYVRRSWKSEETQHIRIKIFNERGRETYGKVDVQYLNISDSNTKSKVVEIEARTIKPDGKIVDLKPEDVFERDIVRADGAKVQAKSFAMPGIEVGAIIEYRWKRIRTDLVNYARLELAREIPIHFVRYEVRPPPNFPFGFRLHSFNTETGFTEDPKGIYSTAMRDVRAFRGEPHMPSEYTVKPWVLAYYGSDKANGSPAEYWREVGKNYHKYSRERIKESGELKTAALKAMGDASGTLEKVRRVFNLCRASVKNIFDDSTGMTRDEQDKFEPSKSPAEVLKRGLGTGGDIDMLFAAMLVSVGIDARLAATSSQVDATFNPDITNEYFIRHRLIAVNIDGKWQFFSPSRRNLPFGMVSWAYEGQRALISDSSDPIWATVPISDAALSETTRRGRLRLAADGTTSGDVGIEFNGHVGEYYRELIDGESMAEREKLMRDAIKRRIGSSADISNIRIDNLEDASKPLVLSVNLSLPAFAERTGRRLFFKPHLFGRQSAPFFTAASREFDIAFNYAWKEKDEIVFEIPTGFAIETSTPVKPVVYEKIGGFLETSLKSGENSKLEFRRSFSFGKSGWLAVSSIFYSTYKGFFDAVGSADAQTLVIRDESAKN